MRLTSNELAAGRNSYNAVVLYSIYWLFKGVHAVVNLSVLSQREAGVRVSKAARVLHVSHLIFYSASANRYDFASLTKSKDKHRKEMHR